MYQRLVGTVSALEASLCFNENSKLQNAPHTQNEPQMAFYFIISNSLKLFMT